MNKKENNNECFVIMPIAEIEGYEPEHFSHVYNDIIKPAVDNANYVSVRADEVKQTNLIHLDILKKLIEAPMAICDLSTRNPNVLFELGIRQAFDKPVVLIQEKGTPKIFDIVPLRYLEYCKEMRYHEVLETQKQLTESIIATKNAVGDVNNINSIVKLMALSSPAIMPNLDNNNKESLSMDVLISQMNDIRVMMERITTDNHRRLEKSNSLINLESERILYKLSKLNSRNLSLEEAEIEFSRLIRSAEILLYNSTTDNDRRMIETLIKRIQRQKEEFLMLKK